MCLQTFTNGLVIIKKGLKGLGFSPEDIDDIIEFINMKWKKRK